MQGVDWCNQDGQVEFFILLTKVLYCIFVLAMYIFLFYWLYFCIGQVDFFYFSDPGILMYFCIGHVEFFILLTKVL